MCEDLVIDLETEDINTFRMVEYKLDPLKNGGELIGIKVVDETINVEFTIIPNMGQFNHYGYTSIQNKSTPGEWSFSGFCIWDMVSQTHLDLYYPKDEVGGEPILDQDDNQQNTYVGVYLFNIVEGKRYFALYDGKTAELVCRLKMPCRVPFGFHGQWIPEKELHDHHELHDSAKEQ